MVILTKWHNARCFYLFNRPQCRYLNNEQSYLQFSTHLPYFYYTFTLLPSTRVFTLHLYPISTVFQPEKHPYLNPKKTSSPIAIPKKASSISSGAATMGAALFDCFSEGLPPRVIKTDDWVRVLVPGIYFFGRFLF